MPPFNFMPPFNTFHLCLTADLQTSIQAAQRRTRSAYQL